MDNIFTKTLERQCELHHYGTKRNCIHVLRCLGGMLKESELPVYSVHVATCTSRWRRLLQGFCDNHIADTSKSFVVENIYFLQKYYECLTCVPAQYLVNNDVLKKLKCLMAANQWFQMVAHYQVKYRWKL